MATEKKQPIKDDILKALNAVVEHHRNLAINVCRVGQSSCTPHIVKTGTVFDETAVMKERQHDKFMLRVNGVWHMPVEEPGFLRWVNETLLAAEQGLDESTDLQPPKYMHFIRLG
jgi:glycine cleavage system aminomethyltransferase T